jgi:Ca2+-transporting ATPase
LTTRQVSIFFSLYVFFQVWNEINCRSLTARESGLRGLWRNPVFLTIAGIIAVVQVLIVTLPGLGQVFKVEPLRFVDWLWIIGASAVVLLFSEAARLIRRTLGTA